MKDSTRMKAYMVLGYLIMISPFITILSARDGHNIGAFVGMLILGISLMVFGMMRMSQVLTEEKYELLRSYYKGEIEYGDGRKQ